MVRMATTTTTTTIIMIILSTKTAQLISLNFITFLISKYISYLYCIMIVYKYIYIYIFFYVNRISKIVYKDIAEKDETVAMNKIILETLLPMYVWTQDGHCKKGSTNPLLLEPRIPLIFTTYAPNLWKVFLMYSQVSFKI